MSSDVDAVVTVHPPRADADRRIAVLYLHGGGLLYGERDDLPTPYVQALTQAGYELVCADYPLCPEASLPQVVDAVFRTWHSAVGERALSGELDGFVLFGRSAGAHLALMLARAIRQHGLPAPLGILDFYGYPGLTDASFERPAKAYAALPAVEHSFVERFAGDEPVTSGPKALRYGLYVYARQHAGAWLELLGLDGSSPERTREAWNLSAEEIAALPPVFACASAGDEDVPYGLGKRFARSCPSAVFRTVYDAPHDFDRDTSRPEGMQMYRAAIAWMERLA